jgi:ligand-binding sensor domain-containing protein
MKYIRLPILFLIVVCHISCEQNQTSRLKEDIKAETRDTVSSYGPTTMVRNVKNGRNGTVLIASSFGGVFRYDASKPKEHAFTNLTSKLGSRRFWDVLEDRRGNLWFATTDSGVYCYNGQSFQHFTIREGLASNGVFDIYEDRAGMIWFGTGGGVSRYDGRTRSEGKNEMGQEKYFQNFTSGDGLSNSAVHTILEDKTGKLWFGTSGEACFYDTRLPDGHGNKFTIFKNKDGKAFYNIWSIIEDRKGNIWFGASIIEDKKGDTVFVENGLWRYDGSTFTKVSNRAACAIIEDKKGNIWTTGSVSPNGVGAWRLSLYDQKTLYNDKPTVSEIMSVHKMLCGIVEAQDGTIWFGSMNGVYRYDKQRKTVTDFKRATDQQ